MTLLNVMPFEGRVTALLFRPSRETGFVKAPTETLELTFAGPVGDCHTGQTRKSDVRTKALYQRDIEIRNVRQLSILSVEELSDIAKRLGIAAIDPGWFGGNMVLQGIPDLTLLPPSTRLQFPSNATIVVDMENYPCSQISEVVEQYHPGIGRSVVKAAMHKRGVTAWVEREGLVRVGDPVRVVSPPNRLYPHAPTVA
jgi:hypothetical protein